MGKAKPQAGESGCKSVPSACLNITEAVNDLICGAHTFPQRENIRFVSQAERFRECFPTTAKLLEAGMTNQTPQEMAGVQRGFSPMGEELPSNLLTYPPVRVCQTIAAIYSGTADGGNDRRTKNDFSEAMVALAHFAGGSMVMPDKAHYRALERRVRTYARIMERPQFKDTRNLSFARYLLRHAARRAVQQRVVGRRSW